MIDLFTPANTYLVAAVVYVFSVLVLAVWSRRLPTAVRGLGYALIGMIGVSAVSMLLMAGEIGQFPIGEGMLDIPRLGGDLLAYSLVFFVTAAIAGVSRRLIVIVGTIPILMRLGFEVSNVTGGLVGLLSALVMIGGYFVLAYLLWGPVWRVADTAPDDRRLLYWKCRNLIVFLMGMLIVLGVLALYPPTYDPFTIEISRQYMDVLIRVGYATFIFVAVGSLEDESALDLRRVLSSPSEGSPQ